MPIWPPGALPHGAGPSASGDPVAVRPAAGAGRTDDRPGAGTIRRGSPQRLRFRAGVDRRCHLDRGGAANARPKTPNPIAALSSSRAFARSKTLFTPVVEQAEARLWSGIDAARVRQSDETARACLRLALLEELVRPLRCRRSTSVSPKRETLRQRHARSADTGTRATMNSSPT